MRTTGGLLGLACAVLLAGRGNLDHGILAAQWAVSAHERYLLIFWSLILLFVWVPIVILVPLFAWPYRLSNTGAPYRPMGVSWPFEAFVWLPPTGIVGLLALLLWPATRHDDPYTRPAGYDVPARVQAIELDHVTERARETRTYLIGYVLALVLTAAAFAVVVHPVAAFAGTFAIILTLALVQLVVQFRCFLHISLTRSARDDLLLVLFSAIIITLMVSGALVIINLRLR